MNENLILFKKELLPEKLLFGLKYLILFVFIWVSSTTLQGQARSKNSVDSLLNEATEFQIQGSYSKALNCLLKASAIQSKIKDKKGVAHTNYQIGKVYLLLAGKVYRDMDTLFAGKQIQPDTNLGFARDYFNQSLKWAKKNKDTLLLSSVNKGLAEVEWLKRETKRKIENIGRGTKRQLTPEDKSDSLDMLRLKLKETQDRIVSHEKSQKLTERERDSLFRKLFETQGQIASYEREKYTDSIRLENEKRQLTYQKDSELIALKFEYDRKQELAKNEKEREKLRFEQKIKEQKILDEYAKKTTEAEQRYQRQEMERRQKAVIEKINQDKKDSRNRVILNSSLLGFLVVLIFSIVVFLQRNRVKKEMKNVETEKARSEELLLNILPEDVAEELKKTGASKARRFQNVTVLFSDYKSFTQFSEKISAEELVEELHSSFKVFDSIMGKYGIEKIKTIGDSYMAAGGFGHDDKQSVIDTVKAGLEMQDYIVKLKAKRELAGEKAFEMRVGIHTGHVVAGIVGVRKFAYDIWGDTVNTASRMESSGEPGKINISEFTYDIIKDVPDFIFTPRGKIIAKGKGEMEMYFVELRNPELN